MKYALGKFTNEKNLADGKKSTPKITVSVQTKSKQDEERISKIYSKKGFSTGTRFKNDKSEVYLPGTFWINKSVLGEKELNSDVSSRLDGKNVFFENGYLKGVDKAYYSSYNNKTEKSNTIFRVHKNKEGKEMVSISGNLVVTEKEGKKYMFLSNKVSLETKEGKEWSKEAIQDNLDKLSAFGLNGVVNEFEGKKYLDITKGVFGSSTSVLSDEKLLEKIAKEKPFVVIEEPLFRYLDGGQLMVDKNNRITPLGEASNKVFKSVDKLLTKVEKAEDLYATTEQEQPEETKVEKPKTAKKEAVKVVSEKPKTETKAKTTTKAKTETKVEKPKTTTKKALDPMPEF